jgi:hypothetical protein
MYSRVWCLFVFLSHLAGNQISPGMLVESLGNLTALQELLLHEVTEILAAPLGNLTALQKLYILCAFCF